ncbi:Hexadecenal dehydrogenase [Paramarasmius palmivorus]|uniref:Aldehyde dehydrogenase n=1 Tax=Paramarasmius palmivorus TaxID=297713 RepID=A0AAW0DKH3_9AGAR
MSYTPIADIPKIHAALHKTFLTRATYPLEWRQQQLLQVARMLQENHKAFADAIQQDLGRPYLESYMNEVNAIIERSLISVKQLPDWAKDEDKSNDVPEWQKDWKPRIHRTPKGVVLIIAPWNYPVILSLQPLIGAIAAGCPAVLKPSEVASHVSDTLAEYIPKYLDTNAYQVVTGGVPETTKLLELKWDHIFYTGNGTIARIIAKAAAQHLTPLTLELGGKSPVIVDPATDLEVAAKRILFGKTSNAGQICVSPDYVLIPTGSDPTARDRFVEALKKAYAECFPDEGPLDSPHYSRIINPAHYNRVTSLLERTKGQVVLGGGKDSKNCKIEPTVIVDVEEGDALLEGENFGPLLPIVTVNSVEEAVERINQRDHPLVLYVFSQDEKFKVYVRENTMSGGIVYNDTFMQLAVNELPFGGVGESGYGRQVLRYTYELFSYQRSSVDMPYAIEPGLAMRYPPYTPEKFQQACARWLEVEIPKSAVDV